MFISRNVYFLFTNTYLGQRVGNYGIMRSAAGNTHFVTGAGNRRQSGRVVGMGGGFPAVFAAAAQPEICLGLSLLWVVSHGAADGGKAPPIAPHPLLRGHLHRGDSAVVRSDFPADGIARGLAAGPQMADRSAGADGQCHLCAVGPGGGNLGPAMAHAPGKTLEKRAILIPTCNQYVSCNPFVILLS